MDFERRTEGVALSVSQRYPVDVITGRMDSMRNRQRATDSDSIPDDLRFLFEVEEHDGVVAIQRGTLGIFVWHSGHLCTGLSSWPLHLRFRSVARHTSNYLGDGTPPVPLGR